MHAKHAQIKQCTKRIFCCLWSCNTPQKSTLTSHHITSHHITSHHRRIILPSHCYCWSPLQRIMFLHKQVSLNHHYFTVSSNNKKPLCALFYLCMFCVHFTQESLRMSLESKQKNMKILLFERYKTKLLLDIIILQLSN